MATISQKPMSRSLRIYQKAAIVFVVLTLLLLLAVLYLSVSQATIRVVPNDTIVSATASVEVTDNPLSANQVEGSIAAQSFTKAETFYLPEEGATAVESQATGTVTLINETSSDQPLVATTRLLSEEGVLFRLKNAETVPANGQVDVEVYADEEGLSGEIGPTQFTIPGLSTSLQEVIYAVSVESMTGGVSYVRTVAQKDLDEAVAKLTSEILEESKATLKASAAPNATGESYVTEVVEQISDTEPGEETGSFNISVTVKVTGIFYDKETLGAYTEAQLYQKLQDGYQILEVHQDALQTTVQSVNVDGGNAVLEAYMDAEAVVTSGADILSPARMKGKSADEVVAMLEASDAIDDVAVEFTPFWLKRVPTLEDHIKVEIVQ